MWRKTSVINDQRLQRLFEQGARMHTMEGNRVLLEHLGGYFRARKLLDLLLDSVSIYGLRRSEYSRMREPLRVWLEPGTNMNNRLKETVAASHRIEARIRLHSAIANHHFIVTVSFYGVRGDGEIPEFEAHLDAERGECYFTCERNILYPSPIAI